ncbi:hypothetical protein Hanom_Chr17g01548051 [Helianthus anomalus]
MKNKSKKEIKDIVGYTGISHPRLRVLKPKIEIHGCKGVASEKLPSTILAKPRLHVHQFFSHILELIIATTENLINVGIRTDSRQNTISKKNPNKPIWLHRSIGTNHEHKHRSFPRL